MTQEQAAGDARCDYDIAVAGGGVNGCGLARDAAGRGLRVLLCEADDIASATSSASSKLIHGGLRYLENMKFALVRQSLHEREVLLKMAPHVIRPMRFVMPIVSKVRPAWMVRVGLALYDHLSRRDLLEPTRMVDLSKDAVGAPLADSYARAFEYSDCWVDDARLVVLNAMDAKERGATVLTRSRLEKATSENGRWLLSIGGDGQRETSARVLVNATGPWASDLRAQTLGHTQSQASSTRLVQGSHIVVASRLAHDSGYLLQGKDRRVVFALPFLDKFTLIGTTDREYEGDPRAVEITEGERDYLVGCYNAFFGENISAGDIVWSYSGVRGLFDDGAKDAQEVTREYVVKVDAKPAPLISVFGGKLTTYRSLAEEVMRHCAPFLNGLPGPWTAGSHLPGGDFLVGGHVDIAVDIAKACKGLDPGTAMRLARSYGTRALSIVEGANGVSGLGRELGTGLYERELEHLAQNEWAKTAEDVVWRRTKLGIELGKEAMDDIAAWLGEQPGAR